MTGASVGGRTVPVTHAMHHPQKISFISETNMAAGNVHDWLLDTGAPMHTCLYKSAFYTYNKAPQGLRCYTANRTYAPVEGKGQVILKFATGKIIILDDVWHVPEFARNLVSGSKLCDMGFMIDFDSQFFTITGNKIPVGFGYRYGGQYKLCAVVEGQGLAFTTPVVSPALHSAPKNMEDHNIKRQKFGNGQGELPQGLEVLKATLQSETVPTDSNQEAVPRPVKPEIIIID